MAIKIPAHCRGITAGALRHVKETGHTTAGKDGGFWDVRTVSNNMANVKGYTGKTEPLGMYMTQLDEAQKTLNSTAEAVSESARRMVKTAEDASLSLVESSRKMRDATEKLSAQMQKFNSIFSSAKFAEQAEAATKLADALERLSALERTGALQKMMAAMK